MKLSQQIRGVNNNKKPLKNPAYDTTELGIIVNMWKMNSINFTAFIHNLMMGTWRESYVEFWPCDSVMHDNSWEQSHWWK